MNVGHHKPCYLSVAVGSFGAAGSFAAALNIAFAFEAAVVVVTKGFDNVDLAKRWLWLRLLLLHWYFARLAKLPLVDDFPFSSFSFHFVNFCLLFLQ